MKIILGSSSPFRRQVLKEAGIDFEVVVPDIDEKKVRAASHQHTPVVLSYAKACAVAQKVTEPAIIIACDQVIVCHGHILEKPETPEDIRQWYKLYAKHRVHYVNGFTVLNTQNMVSLTAREVSVTTFQAVPADFLEEQIGRGVIFNCAGAINDEIQDAYATIIHGSRQSTIGLPVDFILEMIEKVK